MQASRRRVRLRPEHAEHAGILRVITLAMGWSAGIALGLATGDMPIAIVLTLVITMGHLVSWRTRMWRSARWQIVLLVPISIVALLLCPARSSSRATWTFTALSSASSTRRPAVRGGRGAARSLAEAPWPVSSGRASTVWKVLPLPGTLSSQMRPPIIFVSWPAMVSPSPVPPNSRVVEPSAWVKA